MYDLQKILKNPELHLKLTKSESFINLTLGTFLPRQEQIHHQGPGHGAVGRPRKTDFVSQQMTEKLKASNFSASLLRIGKWEVTLHTIIFYHHLGKDEKFLIKILCRESPFMKAIWWPSVTMQRRNLCGSF